MSVIIVEQFLQRGPDQNFVRHDANGRQLFSFAIEYRMDNVLWAADIWAYSHADAEARVEAMKETLGLCGQIFCEVPRE